MPKWAKRPIRGAIRVQWMIELRRKDFHLDISTGKDKDGRQINTRGGCLRLNMYFEDMFGHLGKYQSNLCLPSTRETSRRCQATNRFRSLDFSQLAVFLHFSQSLTNDFESTLIFQTNLPPKLLVKWLVVTVVLQRVGAPAVDDGSSSAGPLQLAPDRLPRPAQANCMGLNGFILPHVPA
jgi:hypothetical protein